MIRRNEKANYDITGVCMDCTSREIDFDLIRGIYVCCSCDSRMIRLSVMQSRIVPAAGEDDHCQFFHLGG